MIVPTAPAGVADDVDHYTELDRFYREIWGEHVHHGLWTTGRRLASEFAPRRVVRRGAGGGEHRALHRQAARIRRGAPRAAPRGTAGGLRLATDAGYRRFVASGASRNRVFLLTLARIWAAYRSGAMRYAVFVARR